MRKSIDFDKVAHFYDTYANPQFDIEFWREEAHSAGERGLELMCGTGRLGLPLIETGLSYCGLDYSEGLLARFKEKLRARGLQAQLVCAEARDFDLGETFDFVYLAFGSLAEVLDNSDKLRLLRAVKRHLKASGRFTLSIANSIVGAARMDGKRSSWMEFPFQGDRRLQFATQFSLDPESLIASGQQFYRVFNNSDLEREVVLDIKFHRIGKSEMEQLLANAGFQILQTWGDYDRSAFSANSPHVIYRCNLQPR